MNMKDQEMEFLFILFAQLQSFFRIELTLNALYRFYIYLGTHFLILFAKIFGKQKRERMRNY